MKFLFTATMALGTLCLLDMNLSANATHIESDSPHLYLARGGHMGGHARGHAEGRDEREEGRGEGEEGRDAGENRATDSNAATDHPAQTEDRMHTLDNAERNTLRKDEAWGDGAWGGGWGGVCPDGQYMNESGNCVPTSQ